MRHHRRILFAAPWPQSAEFVTLINKITRTKKAIRKANGLLIFIPPPPAGGGRGAMVKPLSQLQRRLAIQASSARQLFLSWSCRYPAAFCKSITGIARALFDSRAANAKR